jgi:hypothetical protein
MQGALIDLRTRDNLTAVSEGALRRGQLDAVPRNRRIVFSPPNPKYRITVFTDIDCGYCRKLHAQINDYMKAASRSSTCSSRAPASARNPSTRRCRCGARRTSARR